MDGDRGADNAVIEGQIEPLMGAPWSIDFGYAEDEDGVIWVVMTIHNVHGTQMFTCPPEFAEKMSNMWHTMAVKAKHHKPGGLVVPRADVSQIVEQLRTE